MNLPLPVGGLGYVGGMGVVPFAALILLHTSAE